MTPTRTRTPLDVPARFLEAARSLRDAYRDTSPRKRLPLVENTIGEAEIAAAMEALVRGPLTQGPRVEAFEKEFASAVGAPHAVFCNSGSSAILLMLSVLARPAPRIENATEGKAFRASVELRAGDEVIVPAVTWSTSLWPVVQTGAVPVLADVSPETLNVTVESVEAAMSPRTKAILTVHLLGNPAPVYGISELCRRRGIPLLEDACEALDAEVSGKKAGSFGRMGGFSFYFSHHITTIEGGMVVCASEEDARRLRMIRSHGWTRPLPDGPRRAVEARHPEIDPRFLFLEPGYNLRGTELQAAIGRVQLARRGAFLKTRRRVAAEWTAAVERFDDLFAPVRFSPGSSPFAFPLVLRPEAKATRTGFVEFLEGRGIETRPLVAGNLARQPALAGIPHRLAGPLPGADLLHERAIYVGLHGSLNDRQIALLPQVLEDYARKVRG